MPEPQTPNVDSTVQQIERLLEELGHSDPSARLMAEELIRLLMNLYGAGLERMVAALRDSGVQQAAECLAEDKLVASLLLLHGLHPVPPEERIRLTLDRLERKADAEHLVLEDIAGGIARVRVVRNGAPPARPITREIIERAVDECAPDIAGVHIEGLAQPGALVQIELAPGR